MKQNLTYGDLYNEETAIDFLLECMLNEVMCDNKRKSNKNKAPKSVDELVEVSLDEVMESESEPVAVNEPVQVDSIEELLGIEPIAEPVIDEDFAPKCTDIEKAISVLDGSCTDMTAEDFDEEVWLVANETYYSEVDDYVEEVSDTGETVIVMSPDRLNSFMTSRYKTVESWDKDIGAETDEYIYDDDEVNVVEECDSTLFGFRKGFWCMGLKAA